MRPLECSCGVFAWATVDSPAQAVAELVTPMHANGLLASIRSSAALRSAAPTPAMARFVASCTCCTGTTDALQQLLASFCVWRQASCTCCTGDSEALQQLLASSCVRRQAFCTAPIEVWTTSNAISRPIGPRAAMDVVGTEAVPPPQLAPRRIVSASFASSAWRMRTEEVSDGGISDGCMPREDAWLKQERQFPERSECTSASEGVVKGPSSSL
mmetsp:Transcript_93377/g.280146  ORF Transcript_93377/g.280146 Transcript_93377/m.280146 type:complete len:214 (-) Transcript_93377:103-744(-)